VAKTRTPAKVSSIDPADRLMTVNEVADYCRISRPRVYRLMADGALPYVMVGDRRRVRLSDLQAYLDLAS